MPMLYLSNAFSLGMVSPSPSGLTLKVRPISLEEVQSLLKEGYTSAVGHEATAMVLSNLLGMEIVPNRIAIRLVPGDRLVVFQLAVRLAEGQILTAEEVKALHEEGKASFMLVEVLDQ